VRAKRSSVVVLHFLGFYILLCLYSNNIPLVSNKGILLELFMSISALLCGCVTCPCTFTLVNYSSVSFWLVLHPALLCWFKIRLSYDLTERVARNRDNIIIFCFRPSQSELSWRYSQCLSARKNSRSTTRRDCRVMLPTKAWHVVYECLLPSKTAMSFNCAC